MHLQVRACFCVGVYFTILMCACILCDHKNALDCVDVIARAGMCTFSCVCVCMYVCVCVCVIQAPSQVPIVYAYPF